MTRLTIVEPGSVAGPPIHFVDSADAFALSLHEESYPITWAACYDGKAFWAVYAPDDHGVVLFMTPCTMPRHDSLRAVHLDLTRAMVVLSMHLVAREARNAAVSEPTHHGQILHYGRHVGHRRYVEGSVASTLLHRHEEVSAGDLVACISAC